MKIIRKIALPVVAALSLCAATTSCFTGVESTPRITADEVRRASGRSKAEESYLNQVAREPLNKWSEGKQFVVTDPKISLVMNNRSSESSLNAGARLQFRSYTGATDIAGNPTTEIELTDSIGTPYIYTVKMPADSLLTRPVEIPFTIEQSVVDQVHSLLHGKKVYILTPLWRDNRGQNTRALKYIPVTITAVLPGTTIYPIEVYFRPENSENVASVMLNPDRRGRDAHSFAQLFSFSNPRENYPEITDAAWSNIINGTIEPGMTREECRLAVGSPLEIIRRPGYSYMHEAWRYDNGRYLIFEDGILQSQKK